MQDGEELGRREDRGTRIAGPSDHRAVAERERMHTPLRRLLTQRLTCSRLCCERKLDPSVEEGRLLLKLMPRSVKSSDARIKCSVSRVEFPREVAKLVVLGKVQVAQPSAMLLHIQLLVHDDPGTCSGLALKGH